MTDLAQNLADAAFTWSDGTTANRASLHDGRMDTLFTSASDAGGVNVVIDFGAAVNVNAIALLNSNIASAVAPTIAIAFSDNNISYTTAKAATTPNTQTPREREHVLQFPSASHRYWKVTWAWTGNFQLTLGNIFVGATIQPQRYTVFGDEETPEYLVSVAGGYTGESRALYVGGPLRTKTIRLEDLSASERDDYLTMYFAAKGGALPMLWCHLYEATAVAAPNDNQDVIFGRATQPKPKWNGFDFGRYNLDAIVIESMARDIGH